MNQKLLLLTVLLLLGAVVGMLLLRQVDDGALPPDAVRDAPAAAAPADTQSTTTGVVEASADAGGGETVRAEASMASEGSTPIPADATWTEIRIVDKASGEPVADAQVSWYDNSAHERAGKDKSLDDEDRNELWRDGEALAARYGWRTRSDSRGIARVHLADWTQVLARHEGRYGSKALQKNTIAPRDGHRLEIAPDLQALVQVLDLHGQPAVGVPIAVTQHDAQGKLQQVWNWGPSATTRAPNGIATLRHLQDYAANAREQNGTAVPQWRVRTYLPGLEEPGVVFAPDAPPNEPIVLRLPACGRVRVRAELHGNPLAEVTNVNLAENRKEHNRMGPRASLTRRPDAQGWATFAHVPLGCSYSASASVMAGWLNRQFTGPMTLDQEVTVVLTPGDDQILLVGRLLDEQRTPLAEQEFLLRLRGPQMRDENRFQTDAQGRFRLFLGRAQKEQKLEEMSIDLERPGQVALRVEVAPRELAAGRQDLGDLVLKDAALVVSGTFVCGDKPYQPPVGVSVERMATNEGPKGPQWRRVQNLLYHKADDGHFEFRGSTPPGRYRLQFSAWNHLPIEPIEFQPGAVGLVVQVATGSALAASALLPKDLPGDLKAVLVLDGAAAVPEPNPRGRGRDRLVAEPWSNEEGRYQMQWQAVPPGSYTLEFRLWADKEPVLRLADVQVPPPPGGDPRLVDIDLRDSVRIVTVRLFDQEGKAVDNSNGAFFRPGQDPAAEWLGFACHGEVTRLLTRPQPLELLVMIHGFRPQTVACAGDRVDVRLDPWPQIELLVEDLQKLPDGVSLVANLVPVQTEAGARTYRSQWGSGERTALNSAPTNAVTVEGGRARLPIGDGLHQPVLSLQAKRRTVVIDLATPPQVLPNSVSVRVQIPAAALEKALATVTAPAKSPAK